MTEGFERFHRRIAWRRCEVNPRATRIVLRTLFAVLSVRRLSASISRCQSTLAPAACRNSQSLKQRSCLGL